MGGDALTWQFNLTALSVGRRVIALDLPGHGASTTDVGRGEVADLAEWVARVLDALEIGQADMVGHSLGGRIALELMIRHPARLRRATLLACVGLGTGVDLDFLHGMRGIRTLDDARLVVRRLFPADSPFLEPLARALCARMTDEKTRGPLSTLLERSCMAILEGRTGFDWNRVTRPVQLIWGSQDRVVPPPDPARLPASLPLHLLDGVGHMPHFEAASPINALIRSFHQ